MYWNQSSTSIQLVADLSHTDTVVSGFYIVSGTCVHLPSKALTGLDNFFITNTMNRFYGRRQNVSIHVASNNKQTNNVLFRENTN